MVSRVVISNWFLTDAGKRFSFLTAGACTTAVLFGTFLPHTILIDPYKDVVRLYRKGMSVPISKELQDRFKKAKELVQVNDLDKHLFQPFAAYGFDIISMGSVFSRFGVYVGLPANFSYNTKKQVDKDIIKVNNAAVAWESEEGQQLLDALVISEKGQLYAMAREIRYRQTPKTLIDSILATVSCAGAYILGHRLNNKLNLYIQPLGMRLTLYTLVGLFVGFNFLMLKDVSQVYFEEKIDKELKQIPELAEGGKEFYGKIILRNIALRKLLGKDGESLYSVLGNENYFFRTKHVPLIQRKSFFEEV